MSAEYAGMMFDNMAPGTSDVRHIILDTILSHEYRGNGKCSCGAAVGWSDGVSFEVHQEEHVADQAYWLLFDGGLLS